jgi:hypothetical protein
MRLSELLQTEDFKKAGIEQIGFIKTLQGEYAVLGRSGQPAFPVAGTTHLIDVVDEKDPEVSYVEELTIRRRLGVKIPPITFPKK